MGFFISFEGCEGCGKSTQAKLLAANLQQRGYSTTLTHEPGGTSLGEELRCCLKRAREGAISPEAELLLFAAARAQLTLDVILPALEKNRIVICDRYSDSTVAYQGYGRGLDLDTIAAVNLTATRGLSPDVVVLLDMDPSGALARKRLPRDRFEHEGLEFHQRVRDGYLKLAQAEPARWLVLDASNPPSISAQSVYQRVATLLDQSTVSHDLPA